MNGFSGFFHFSLLKEYTKEERESVLDTLSSPLYGKNEEEKITQGTTHFAVASNRANHLKLGDRSCYIALDGDIFNQKEILFYLRDRGFSDTDCPLSEKILLGFLEYGMDFIQKLNGNFSIIIFDERHEILYLFRDHFGSKPLYYTIQDNCIYFSTKIKSLFTFCNHSPMINKGGLNELFSIGPAHTPGKTPFYEINEVLPANCLSINRYGSCSTPYWTLPCTAHFENYEETVNHTRELFNEVIQEEFAIDENPCCLLSGGIDSSIVSAYLAKEMKKRNKRLVTISFDFAQNDKYFKSSSFQPSQDRPYVDAMVRFLGSKHHYLECNYQTLANMLSDSVKAHDLPCMADVDSSLLYFCGLVKELGDVTYTGECADEIFGGYPWFHREEMLSCDTFPWANNLAPRKQLLKKEFLEFLEMDSYVQNAYQDEVRKVKVLPDESPQDACKRRNTYLTIYWFMQTLLCRMDCSARAVGLTARIPFADRRLAEYVYNTPWDMKARNGLVKSLLRQSAENLLPQPILLRKKSPFPKTYHPFYEKLLSQMLIEVMDDSSSVLHQFLDTEQLSLFLANPKDYGSPWYGQLMCGPQMIAYLLQIDYWVREYKVDVNLT